MKSTPISAIQTKHETRLLRIGDVMDMTGLSRSYIYTLSADRRFPRSISLVPGGTSRAWIYSEVQDWLNQRIADRDTEA